MPSFNGPLAAIAAQSIAGTAVALNTTEGDGVLASGAVITVDTAPLRYWTDGSTPTATAGHLVNIGDVIELHDRGEVRGFRAIRTTGVSAVLQGTLYAWVGD